MTTTSLQESNDRSGTTNKKAKKAIPTAKGPRTSTRMEREMTDHSEAGPSYNPAHRHWPQTPQRVMPETLMNSRSPGAPHTHIHRRPPMFGGMHQTAPRGAAASYYYSPGRPTHTSHTHNGSQLQRVPPPGFAQPPHFPPPASASFMQAQIGMPTAPPRMTGAAPPKPPQPFGQYFYNQGTASFYGGNGFHAPPPNPAMYSHRPNGSAPKNVQLPNSAREQDTHSRFDSAPILPSFSYSHPERSQDRSNKGGLRRSSSASNINNTREQPPFDQEDYGLHFDDLASSGHQKSTIDQASYSCQEPTKVPPKVENCKKVHENMTQERQNGKDKDTPPRATSNVGENGKRLVLTVSASPTDNLSPVSNAPKVPMTFKMNSRASTSEARNDIDLVPTPTPPESPEYGVFSSQTRESSDPKKTPEENNTMTLDDDSCFVNHSHNDSFSLLPDLGKECGHARTSPPMMPYLAIVPKLSWEMEEESELADSKSSPNESVIAKTKHESESSEQHAARMASLTPQSELKMMNEPLSRNATPLFFAQSKQEESAFKSGSIASTPSLSSVLESNDSNQNDSKHRETPTMRQLFSRNNASDFPYGISMPYENNDKYMHLSPGQLFAAREIARDDSFNSEHAGEDTRQGPPDISHSPGPTTSQKLRATPKHSPMPVRMPPALPSPRPYNQSLPSCCNSPRAPSVQSGLPSPLPSPPGTNFNQWHSHPECKGRCVPFRHPLPPKFQGDIEKSKNGMVPEFSSLVNFPHNAAQKQNRVLPPRTKCCVMCGQIRPTCSRARSSKRYAENAHAAPPESPKSRIMMDPSIEGDGVTIPLQNKGLCTLCDVEVWIVMKSGMQIKWCKGCKNFRPWAAFGDKGLATKCLRCRERQREKYAQLKESKHRQQVKKSFKSETMKDNSVGSHSSGGSHYMTYPSPRAFE